jgi:hypothetical protein
MARRIRLPVTLRITEAELLESQLAEDDTQALAQEDGGGDGNGQPPVKCQSHYCEAGYSSGAAEEVVLET